MPITISRDDVRSIKALEIALRAGQWLRCRTRDGRKAFGIPSSRDASHVYLVTQTTCTCQDAMRHPGLTCKHQLAVRLHCEIVRSQHSRKGVRPAA